MTAVELIRLLRKNLFLIVGVALATATAVYFLTQNSKQKYTSEALVSTGIISAFSIENPNNNGRIDRDYTISELENLISLATSYETFEELSTILLATYLPFEGPSWKWLEPQSFEDIQELNLQEFQAEIRSCENEQQAIDYILDWREQEGENPIKEVIYSDKAFFGIEYLQERVKVYRRGNSDLLEFEYTTSDPAICQRTLELLIDVFMRRHAELKKSKTSSIVAFFSDAKSKSAARLKSAEDELLAFHTQNKIINYYEQTRSIAYRKEDLDELFFKEKMEFEGSKASMARLEDQLGNKARLSALNDALLDKREELSRLSTQLAKYELMDQDKRRPSAGEREVMRSQLERVKQEINDYTSEAYYFEQTPEGLATENLLNEWLVTMIEVEQAGARLDVILERRQDFDEIYSQYAPWGSTLKRIEREIGLAEDAYLENLHSYNQAILHRENTLMSSKLKMLDAPFYPKDDGGKQRAILILAGLFGGGLLVSATLIALGFMDNSLKNPRLAAERTGLPIAALLPDFSITWRGSKLGKKLLTASERAVTLLVQQTKVEARRKKRKPAYIIMTSLRAKEGKSFVGVQLVNALRNEQKRLLYVYPIWEGQMGHKGMTIPPHADNCPYLVNEEMAAMIEGQGMEWATGGSYDLADYDYVIFEMPGLLSGWYPVSILEKASLVFWVCQAKQSWEPASKQALDVLQKATNCPIKLVLNGVPADSLQTYLGDYQQKGIPSFFSNSKKPSPVLFPG